MFEHKQNTPLAVQFLRIIPQSKTLYGGVAQLGEHLPCKQGVMGSIPIISTSGKLPRPGTIEDRLKSNLQRSLVEPDESRA